MNDFFTQEEIKQIQEEFKNVTGAGIISIDHYKSNDEQRAAFFDKAKLWRVIERAISVLYLDRLVAKGMFLHDRNGYKFTVIPYTEAPDVEET